MLFKILIFAVIIAAIYLRFFYKPKKKKRQDPFNQPPEVMVECSVCGTFISPREAVIQEGHYFCSTSCALLSRKERP